MLVKQHHQIRKQLTALLCVCMLLLLTGCGQRAAGERETDTGASSAGGEPALNEVQKGIAFSVSEAGQRGLDREITASLPGLMQAEAVQVEASFRELLDVSGAIREDAAAVYRAWFSAMRANGVSTILLTVTGGCWGASYDVTDPNAYPYPDSDMDTSYGAFLQIYQRGFASLAAAFPEVSFFQAGNALNRNENAHPVDDAGRGNTFVIKEKAALAVDLAYAARSGVRSVRADASVVMAGISAADGYSSAVRYLEELYAYLSSGRSPYGVVAPQDCFDMLAWEPEICWYDFDAEGFLNGNTALYEVMVRNGGADTRVVLSGFRFSDYGSRNYDQQQAAWLECAWRIIRENMPYVGAFFPVPLLEAGSGEEEEIYSGAFRVFGTASFGAKEKARALCSIYEGECGQLDQYIGENQVYIDRPGLEEANNGIGFAIKGAEERGLNISRIMDLLEAMNVECMRNWMNLRTLLLSPTQLNDTEVALQKQWIAQLNRRGVHKIIGMSQNAFWPEETDISDPSAVPYRDLEDGSLYLRFLEQDEQSWFTLASAFPEITYWEVGNETNSNSFLHPLDYTLNASKTFTLEEKALITADMCYTAAQAIRRANPDAVIIFPAMAPVNGFESMAAFLDRVYEGIEAGECIGGTDPDDYFDAMAWHCYYFSETFTPENWLEGNNSVYQVMAAHGDGEKKVFLTEFGFSDGGDAEKDALQASYFKEIYRLAQESMPYLDSLYPFRMVEDETAAEWGGSIEIYYGLFRVFDAEHFGAKEKARAICEIYGGDVSRLDQYNGGMSVYPR